jgi:nucleotide-binding universal stress UspA family protein
MVMDFKRIIVPVDFSENSRRALEVGQELATRFGAELHLFHSQPISWACTSPYDSVLPANYFEDITKAAAKKLHEWRDQYCDEKLEIAEHLSELPAPAAILELADTLDADLIVMGTRGLGALKHVLLGSVAERVVQRAKCPVLTVKEQ